MKQYVQSIRLWSFVGVSVVLLVGLLAQPAVSMQYINDDLTVTGYISSEENTAASNNFMRIHSGTSADRSGFYCYGYNAANNGDYSIFTMRTDFADTVYSVYDASAGMFHPAFSFYYLQDRFDFKGNRVENIGDKLLVGTNTSIITPGTFPLEVHRSNGDQALFYDPAGNHTLALDIYEAGIYFYNEVGSPFHLENDTPDDTLYLGTNGGVNIGSGTTPQGGLEIERDINDYELVLTEAGAADTDHCQMRFNTGQDYVMGVNADTGIFYLSADGMGDLLRFYPSTLTWIFNTNTYTDGNSEILGNLTVDADFQCSGTKSFITEDPTDPTKMIHYAALEGPEAGIYVRGTAEVGGGRGSDRAPGALHQGDC